MIIFVSIIGCLFVLVFNWFKLKDVTAPTFIISTVWMIIYILLVLFRKDNVDLGSIYYSSFFVGLFFFVIGFFFIVGEKNKQKCEIKTEAKISNLCFNSFLIKIVILIEVVLFIILLLKVTKYVSYNYLFNLWQSLSVGKRTGMYNEGLIITYSRNPIIAFSLVCNMVYFTNNNKKNKKYFVISLIIASVFVFTGGNRGILFIFMISHFFSFLILKNYSNKKTSMILGILIVILLSIFITFAYFKFVYVDTSDTSQFIYDQIRKYFSSSMIAFVEWEKNFHDYLYGKNTFRFFTAILNTLGYDIRVAQNVQDTISINDAFGERTNVYTILHYYASDFGLIFAFMIQLILGMIHGFLYKKSVLSKKVNPFFVALQSLLYFPLINQFFDDKYFSILSTWIQFIFWLWIFTRKRFLITDKSDP